MVTSLCLSCCQQAHLLFVLHNLVYYSTFLLEQSFLEFLDSEPTKHSSIFRCLYSCSKPMFIYFIKYYFKLNTTLQLHIYDVQTTLHKTMQYMYKLYAMYPIYKCQSKIPLHMCKILFLYETFLENILAYSGAFTPAPNPCLYILLNIILNSTQLNTIQLHVMYKLHHR